MIENAYIHIPFCRQKCNYCAFQSFAVPDYIPKYIETLKKEIKLKYGNEDLKTIYFGGGTPSLLSACQINAILDELKYNSNTEITLEINPETADKDYLKTLKNETPVNRLSIGVQTFDDEKLRALGRLHNSKRVFEVISEAKKQEFRNISIDLMYGLPSQTVGEVEKDVDTALTLNTEHISLYGLKIERGTNWSHKPPENLPNDDIQADMYEKIIELLTKNGYIHYEISNFSLPGFESKHNLSYWKNKNYYGFGLGASGYEGNERYTNAMTFKRYFENPVSKSFSYPLTPQEITEDEIYLGLRCAEGINIECFNEKFNVNFKKKYIDIIEKYTQTGHLQIKNGNLFLTTKGMLISNEIFSEFIEI